MSKVGSLKDEDRLVVVELNLRLIELLLLRLGLNCL